MLNNLVDMLNPLLMLAVTILAPLAAAAIVKLFQKWGIDIEAQHRAALQSALHNAATIAVSKMTTKPAGNPLDTVHGEPARPPSINPAAVPINIAVDYVKKSVPDALDKFGLDDNRVVDMLAPHIAEAMERLKIPLNSRL